MNWHRIDENYQLKNGIIENNNWRFIINQLIHSFTFLPVYNDNKFCGILFNSDSTKNKFLFFLHIKNILEMLLKISEGSIVESHSGRTCKINHDGQKVFGDMHLVKSKYAYSASFDLNKVVKESMKGIIYKRDKILH